MLDSIQYGFIWLLLFASILFGVPALARLVGKYTHPVFAAIITLEVWAIVFAYLYQLLP